MKFTALYKKYRGRGMASSCYETPEFRTFATAFARGLKAGAKEHGMEVVTVNKGHFYCFGFIRRADGRLVYFSVSDMRDYDALDRLLYRFAVNEKDYSGRGGRNCYTSLDRFFEAIEKESFALSGIPSAYTAVA